MPRGRLAPAANTPDLPIKRDVVRMAFNAARVKLSRRLMLSRAFALMMRTRACEMRSAIRRDKINN